MSARNFVWWTTWYFAYFGLQNNMNTFMFFVDVVFETENFVSTNISLLRFLLLSYHLESNSLIWFCFDYTSNFEFH